MTLWRSLSGTLRLNGWRLRRILIIDGYSKQAIGEFVNLLQNVGNGTDAENPNSSEKAQLTDIEFMQIALKDHAENVNQNDKMVYISETVLPKNERQIRPLIEKLITLE